MKLPDLGLSSLNARLPKGPAGLLVRLGLALVVLLLAVQLVVLPLTRRSQDLDADIAKARQDLAAMRGLAAEYAALRATDSVAVRAAAGDEQAFYAFVEGLTRELGLAGNVESIRPARRELEDGLVEEEVGVRFKGLLLPQFVDFLYAAEMREGGVEVRQVGMRKDKQRRLDADVTLTLVHTGR